MDTITKEGNSLEFACICVEMRVNHEFQNVIELYLSNGDCVELRVKYAWKPLCCNECKSYGQEAKECEKRNDGKDNTENKTRFYKLQIKELFTLNGKKDRNKEEMKGNEGEKLK